MQALGVVTNAQLLMPDPRPLMKVEILIGGFWKNLNSLDGENYVKNVSVSLGGASMTPNPVAGKWSVTLFNKDGVFHPEHPTSAYKDYLRTEILTRISIGAIYDGVPKYWQRIIGFMDIPTFSTPDYRVAISGGDYMKRLQETEFRHLHNYWGSNWTTNSISSEGKLGVEQYNEADAMDITGEADNVTNWTPSNCTFVSLAELGGGSSYVGKLLTDTSAWCALVSGEIFTPAAGTEYVFQFKSKRVSSGGDQMYLDIIQGAKVLIEEYKVFDTTTEWHTTTVYFTTETTDPIEFIFHFLELSVENEYWLDQFTIWSFVPYWDRYYDLRAYDANEEGVHHVTLDVVDVWQGEEDEGWYYAEDAEAGPDPPTHPAGIVFFDPNKTVTVGVNNLIIYYYTATAPEDAVARILYMAGVFDPATNVPYVDEAATKAAMVAAPGYVATGITIDKIWFKPGTTYLEAIKKLCERGTDAGIPYVFYFTYDGQPVFKPKPTVGAADFMFTDPKHRSSIKTYQTWNEIKNRIIIKGYRQAEPVSRDETRPSQFTDERADDGGGGSIELYGERTLTINNHLFQDLGSITAMCISLLAKYKDPKWYSDLTIPFNPVPLELGDSISWIERLSPTLNTATQTGLIRDIKINNYNMTYKCEL